MDNTELIEAEVVDTIEDDGEETGMIVRERYSDTLTRPARQTVFVETGRGNTAEVQVGEPFGSTIEALAEQAHYGGYFRVYLNGDEIVNPADSPATFQPGMRVSITSYDKVG
jgi:hypothetical protein